MVTLVVEDGTGLANANVWTSMEESYTYHDEMGHALWATVPESPIDEDRATAKIRGARYINNRYGTQWPGVPVNGREQSMAWPRENAFDKYGQEIDDESVPREVKIASMEAEWREFLDPGSLSPDVVLAQQVLSERVGSLAVTYSDTSGVQASIPIVSEIDDILSPILGRNKGTLNSNVVRM